MPPSIRRGSAGQGFLACAKFGLDNGESGYQTAERGRSILEGFPMEYTITAAVLLAVVAGSIAAVTLGGYGIAQLIASAL
jgi:hypothetical protein